MAVGGAWVDLSCVDSANERDYRFYKRTPFVKKAEEGSNNRSVMSFRCSGLHARYNVIIKEFAKSIDCLWLYSYSVNI